MQMARNTRPLTINEQREQDQNVKIMARTIRAKTLASNLRWATKLPARECWVYMAYDAAGSLLYVGQSANVETRMKQHRSLARWWGRCDRISAEPYPTRADALQAEYDAVEEAIDLGEPIYNDTMTDLNFGQLFTPEVQR